MMTTDLHDKGWSAVDWKVLARLRERFLSFDASPGGADYWSSEKELAGYDQTFAERIGWKWDTVIAELQARGWQPPEGTVMDWGCGSGVAGRRVVSAWPGRFGALVYSDRSRRAMAFAAGRAKGLGVAVSTQAAGEWPKEAPAVLLLSHLLNELPPNSETLERLLSFAERATAVIWVEPGTSVTAGRLVGLREQLLERFHPVAPCPSAGKCGLLAPENARHWCHHFARVPKEVFQDANWGRFAKMMDIDLTSLPFSMLVLDKRPLEVVTGSARVIGVPRFYKGYAKLLACEGERVEEVLVQKRDGSEAFRALKKSPGSLYRWRREGQRAIEVEEVF